MTTAVEAKSSLRVGHFTFLSSVRDSLRNWREDRTILETDIPLSDFFSASLLEGTRDAFFFISLSGRPSSSEGDAAEVPEESGTALPIPFFFSCLFIVPAQSLSLIHATGSGRPGGIRTPITRIWSPVL